MVVIGCVLSRVYAKNRHLDGLKQSIKYKLAKNKLPFKTPNSSVRKTSLKGQQHSSLKQMNSQ